MSIINNSYKFIFVHVPKAAGTSVTNALSVLTNYCDLEIGGTHFGERVQGAYRERFGLAKHSTATEIRNVVGTVLWSRYVTFSFVRNPFTRCLSTYHFLRKWEGGNPELRQQIQSFETFDDYVLSKVWDESNGPDQIFRPQAHWLRSPAGANSLLVNYLGKLETLESDLQTVLHMIDAPKKVIENLKLLHLNKSQEKVELISKNTRVVEKIIKRYAIDFELFKYTTNPEQLD